MFNFLFEGKLGEMLAPVLPMNQLFLAIQNHRNNELQSLISSGQFDLRKPCEGGYCAIHVASRYNNTIAIDYIVQRGVPIELADYAGNTTLHYAAKAGQLEACRFLIEHGCSPAKKNNSGQTPYDVTESHLVRQYLLPLIFKYEQQDPNSYSHQPPSSTQHYTDYSTNNAGYAQTMVTNSPSAVPGINQVPPYGPQPVLTNDALSVPRVPSFSNTQIPIQSQNQTVQNSFVPPPQHPPNQTLPSTLTASSAVVSSDSSSIRKIKADGFHSSASDPELQAKYGHIKPTISIAPPPTVSSFNNAAGNAYSAYSGASIGQSQSVYSRYPVYDPNTNTSLPAPPSVQSTVPPNGTLSTPSASMQPGTIYNQSVRPVGTQSNLFPNQLSNSVPTQFGSNNSLPTNNSFSNVVPPPSSFPVATGLHQNLPPSPYSASSMAPTFVGPPAATPFLSQSGNVSSFHSGFNSSPVYNQSGLTNSSYATSGLNLPPQGFPQVPPPNSQSSPTKKNQFSTIDLGHNSISNTFDETEVVSMDSTSNSVM